MPRSEHVASMVASCPIGISLTSSSIDSTAAARDPSAPYRVSIKASNVATNLRLSLSQDGCSAVTGDTGPDVNV